MPWAIATELQGYPAGIQTGETRIVHPFFYGGSLWYVSIAVKSMRLSEE